MSTIVCLGDSITGACDPRHYLKWSQLLQLQCDACWGPGVQTVLNAGVAGNTVQQMSDRYDSEVAVHEPAVVILLAGANDAAQGRLDGLSDRLQALGRRIIDDGARLIMASYALLVDERDGATVWSLVADTKSAIAAAAAVLSCPLVDLQPAFDVAAETADPASLVAPGDGLHLNPGGELVVATTIFPVLHRVLDSCRAAES